MSGSVDTNFDERYAEFWEQEDHSTGQRRLFSIIDKPVSPHPCRLDLDLAVSDALGIHTTPESLQLVYEAIVNEMIITRRLARD